jgi:glycosyltransferase involved in cell wall biosynthesis
VLGCFPAEPKASACQLSKRWLRLAKILGTPADAAPELQACVGGILVKPKDPEDMAKPIEQICQLSDAEWRAMSKTALEKVINYDWEDATNLFEATLYAAVECHAQLTNKA